MPPGEVVPPAPLYARSAARSFPRRSTNGTWNEVRECAPCVGKPLALAQGIEDSLQTGAAVLAWRAKRRWPHRVER